MFESSKVTSMAPEGIDYAFFVNSGSEAVDTALKMALAYHRIRGDGTRTRFIGREKGYHGVGFGGISVGGLSPNRKMFGTMLPKGTSDVKLSKMNMGGMGTAMMKSLMKKKNVASLEQMLAMAEELGGVEKVERQHHFGKLTIRERLEGVTPFIPSLVASELGRRAAVMGAIVLVVVQLVVLPIAGRIMQQPIKEAALIAKAYRTPPEPAHMASIKYSRSLYLPGPVPPIANSKS